MDRQESIITLFEYGNWRQVKDKTSLKAFLQNIWQARVQNLALGNEADENIDTRYQPFLKFDDDYVRANNYVGFIQNGDQLIEIYPKVFRNAELEDKAEILRQLFYWFRYCRKWRFPFSQASLGTITDSFPELIIYLIAKQIGEIVSTHPFLQYQPSEESTSTPKGTINFGRYISRSFSRGNYHLLDCDYEPFVYDNKVNRIIKYCCRLLLTRTSIPDTQRIIQEAIFILDDVEDLPCSIHDFETIVFNSFFEDYKLILDTCKNIIEQQMYSNASYDLSQWSILFPMEYIFEDFVAGFLETHFGDQVTVEYQKSDLYLSNEPQAFNLQNDILLTVGDRKIIIDTKYKLRDPSFKTDVKKGVVQSDMYQVLSYAYKRGCTEVILLYPNLTAIPDSGDSFIVKSAFSNAPPIIVSIFEIPFSGKDMTQLDGLLKKQLKSILGL